MGKRLCLLPLLVLSLMIAGCGGGQTLTFETIEQAETLSDAGGYEAYTEDTPALLIIASPEDIDRPNMAIAFSDTTKANLRQVDFEQAFAVFVFHGEAATSHYGVTVQEIHRVGNKVVIEAHFREPEGFVFHIVTSPYHLISVNKAGRWGRHIRFVLEKDGQTIYQTRHFIL